MGWLDAAGVDYRRHGSLDALVADVARRLAGGAIVRWFHGRMEFGPRALGHRSILADPRDPANVGRINARVKGREGFRPFAPSVMAEHTDDWFELEGSLPYMIATVPVRSWTDRSGRATEPMDGFADRLMETRSDIPACTHIDGTARVQTVDVERNPDFHRLLAAFHELTGCPVLLNTSLNRRDEPIVRTPADAFRCHRDAGLDLLVMGTVSVDAAAARALELSA